ncbi:MAG: alpha/beta hydrolase [Gemmatimonadota bacterium]
MRRSSFLLGSLLLAVTAPASSLLAQEVAVERILAPGSGAPVHVWELRSEATRGRPFILLFHQGGASGPAEYAPLLPRLRALGYNLLVVDQRSGGELFGGRNRTAAAYAEEPGYCEALPDLEVALEHARRVEPERRAILWGSSYSAALVIQLAARRTDDVAAVLAFSPATGEPMEGCRPEPWAENLDLPLLALRPRSEAEIPSVREQLDRLEAMGHRTFVADPGAHGSSMLVADRAHGDVAATWAVVEAFLQDAQGRTSLTPR